MTGLQQLQHFVKQPALRHIGQQHQRVSQRFSGLGVQRESERTELRGEAHGADDAHRILAVTRRRITDHPQGALLRVLQALVVVHDNLGLRVVVHRVDREIAAHCVFFLRAPDVVAQDTARGIDGVLHAGQIVAAGLFVARHLFGSDIVQIGPKGRHLDDLMLAPAPENHVHDAKTASDDKRPPEQGFHLLGRGVGGDVKVLRAQSDQKIPHGAAHDIGLVAALLERAHHVEGPLIDQFGVDTVNVDCDLLAFAEPGLAGTGAGLSKQFVDEFLDHS
ncbi:MAG: hypothetical protein BWX79_01475 [Alphaproteobacteria bacterium ADurb.Bin100]|nr:MAG: hypothetical protein BWX79_01475 [Alphaproteobacteria bacterium ADurb.Bin100]